MKLISNKNTDQMSRSTNDTRPSSLSNLTLCIYVLIKTHSPVCYSSANPSWSYRWSRSSSAIKSIFKRSSDLHGKYSVIRWEIRDLRWNFNLFAFSLVNAVPWLMKYKTVFTFLCDWCDLFSRCFDVFFC